MKLDTNLFAAKTPSLEEGPMSYQQPEAIAANCVEKRSHYQRCVQVLKVILYIELILFVGWLGCVSMAKYYQEPFVNPDRNNDSSDGQHEEEPMLHAEPSISSAEIISSEMNSPVETYVIWMREDDPLPTNTELTNNYEATIEPVVDVDKDLIEVENSFMNSNTDEADPWNLDTYLKKWLKEMADEKTKDDHLDDRQHLEEPFKDTYSGSFIAGNKMDDSVKVDEPFKSFNDHWKKIMASIDESPESLGSKSDSSDESKGSPWMRVPYFGRMDPAPEDDSDMVPDSSFDLFHSALRKFSDPDASQNSEELDSSSDLKSVANLQFDFKDPLVNERKFWRNIRDTHAGNDSDSQSSSEETTIIATETERSAESPSNESDDNSDSSFRKEDDRPRQITEALLKTCEVLTKLLTEDELFDRVNKTWHDSLKETPVPDCVTNYNTKIIIFKPCIQFTYGCQRPENKTETD